MKNASFKYFLALGILLIASKEVAAQKPKSRGNDTTIKNTTLEVYQVYKPELKPYVRHELQPSLPPQPAQQPEPVYTVPQQTLNFSYRSLPLRPLALGKDTTHEPKQSFIKLGGGNLNTVTGEVGLGKLHGNGWEANALAYYLHQEGNIAGQKVTHFGLAADGNFQVARQTVDAVLEIDHRKYGQYGFEQYTGVQPAFTYGRAEAGLRKTAIGSYDIDVAPRVAFSVMTASNINTERTVAFELPFSKTVDTTLRFELCFSALMTQLSLTGSYPSNNVFEIKPAAVITQNNFTARIGIDPAIGRGGNAYLLPQLLGRYKWEEAHLAFSAGWEASVIQNTYRELSLKNPFLLLPTDAVQTRQDEVHVDVDGGIGDHLSFSGRGSWWKWNHLPLFINAWNTDAGKSFDILNDPKITALSLQAGAKYAFAENFSIGFSGAWYAYTQKTYGRVLGEPSVRMRADLIWRPVRELTITTYTSLLDGIYARTASGGDVKLNTTVDIGGGAEYQAIKPLSLFINVANLLNNKNERWLGYQSFGINVWGGLRYRF